MTGDTANQCSWGFVKVVRKFWAHLPKTAAANWNPFVVAHAFLVPSSDRSNAIFLLIPEVPHLEGGTSDVCVSIRDPDTWYGHSDPVLCAARVPLVNTPWRLVAIGHLDLHIHGCRGWICCSQGIKDLEFRGARMAVEIDNHFDGSLVSRDHIHRFLHAEPPHFGDEIISCSAFHDHVSSARPVVWDFCASCVPRSILRCLRETGGTPSANQPYSTSHSKTTVRDVPKILYFVSGIVPFCAVYTEFFFIMSSLWQHQF